jgi:hypothetical protein
MFQLITTTNPACVRKFNARLILLKLAGEMVSCDPDTLIVISMLVGIKDVGNSTGVYCLSVNVVVFYLYGGFGGIPTEDVVFDDVFTFGG